MKKKIYLISCLTLLAIVFYSMNASAYEPITLTQVIIKNVRMLVYLAFFLSVLILTPFSIITAIRGKKKKITFLNNGKKETVVGEIISRDKNKVVFEDKEFKYEAKPSEIIKVKKVNRSLKALLILLISFLILSIMDTCVKYAIVNNQPAYGDDLEYYRYDLNNP